jgi:hypothetical protein
LPIEIYSTDLSLEIYGADLSIQIYGTDLSLEIYGTVLSLEISDTDLSLEIYDTDLSLEIYGTDFLENSSSLCLIPRSMLFPHHPIPHHRDSELKATPTPTPIIVNATMTSFPLTYNAPSVPPQSSPTSVIRATSRIRLR